MKKNGMVKGDRIPPPTPYPDYVLVGLSSAAYGHDLSLMNQLRNQCCEQNLRNIFLEYRDGR